jgi:integrase
LNRREITGSLAERSGKYTAILNLYDEAGRRKQKSVALGIPVKGNKRKAQAMLDELKREYGSADAKLAWAKLESPLFADFLQDWLKTTAPTIERTTYQSYESMIDARLDPFFRERRLRLCDVEPRHIRELHESIFKDGCNANTVIHYHAVVRKALQYAVKNELIGENAADKVDRPKKSKYLAGFYSKDELAALFEATKEDSMAAVIQLAAYYGLRRSEVLGIRWSAVDFARGTLSINHKVTEGKVDGRETLFTEDKLKTKSSFRTLPLIPAVRALLLERQKKQAEYRAMFKRSYCEDYADYICVDEMGKLFRPNYVTDHFKLLLHQNGLRPIRFHDLRHSCASLLLSQGIPMKQIQDWLGHSTFATTADIYSHLDFASKQDSADAIAQAFAPAEPQEAEEPEEEIAEEKQGFGMTMGM